QSVRTEAAGSRRPIQGFAARYPRRAGRTRTRKAAAGEYPRPGSETRVWVSETCSSAAWKSNTLVTRFHDRIVTRPAQKMASIAVSSTPILKRGSGHLQ